MGNHKWNLNLAGTWELFLEDGSKIPAQLPGCTYLALLENKRIENPFWGSNEQAASRLAEQNYIYKRKLSLTQEQLQEKYVELVLEGVDTLATVRINGKIAGKTENAFRTYRLAVKEFLREGINEIALDFEAPHDFMRQAQKKRPLAGMDIGIPGVSYIRKPQYHFGWDWGPSLPPAGVSGKMCLEGYSDARLDCVLLSQEHENGEVRLNVNASCTHAESGENPELIWSVTAPDGECIEKKAIFTNGQSESSIRIPNPQLWWCNGMGEQPLYTVSVALQTEFGKTVDFRKYRVGLRRIELNMDKDQWGDNFQFRINGEPVFAKGANWIPADSFIDRVTDEKLEFYIRSAREANMNMLRVWGGGYYETDRFYDLCDKYGILVWQDFAFACRAYPFDEPGFLKNVKAEVNEQVQRLHHHASLALWCGNNELQLEELLWAKDKALRKQIHQFFFEMLPGWIRETDRTTSYWYGSPSDKVPGKRANTFDCGDTHLWQIWHGLMPVTAFKRFPTRFCSEFGLESLPSKNAIAAFTDIEDAGLESEHMQAHQKSSRGNEKLLYYVTLRHPHPADLDAQIYLTQIMQAEGIRSAVEFWHINKGRCNGALYWQYNDCWPVISWSGIDYQGQYKALHYWAKSFFAPVSIAAETADKKVMVRVINDGRTSWSGKLKWESFHLNGTALSSGTIDLMVDKEGVSEEILLEYAKVLSGEHPKNVVLCLTAQEGGRTVAERNLLLVKEKQANFTKPVIRTELELNGKTGKLTLQSDCFAHHVMLSAENMQLNFSDNFFDLQKEKEKVIYFTLPEEMDDLELKRRLQVRSYTDFEMLHTPIKDAWKRFRMRWSLKGIKGRLMTQI